MALISEVTGCPETCGLRLGEDDRYSSIGSVFPRKPLVFRFAIQKGAQILVRMVIRDV
jgi:hypothetical protein